MQDGIYKVEFKTPLGTGAGVVIMEGGKVRGGDFGMYYTGTYSLSGNDLSANVEGRRHTSFPGMASVFGVDHTHITLTGKTQGNSAAVTGTAREAPSVKFSASLTKLPD